MILLFPVAMVIHYYLKGINIVIIIHDYKLHSYFDISDKHIN